MFLGLLRSNPKNTPGQTLFPLGDTVTQYLPQNKFLVNFICGQDTCELHWARAAFRMRLQTFLLLCLVLGICALPRGGGRGGGGRGGGGRGGWGRGSSGRSSSRSWGSWGRRSSTSRSSWSSSGSRLGGRSSLAGGGFVKPKPAVFKPNKFGQTQYSSFSKPSRPIGSYAGVGGKKYGYRTPGHGTNWGTSFSGGTGVYNKKKKRGMSKKALGLGVAAGFVGGAALGAAGTMATYSVYHRWLVVEDNLLSCKRHLEQVP